MFSMLFMKYKVTGLVTGKYRKNEGKIVPKIMGFNFLSIDVLCEPLFGLGKVREVLLFMAELPAIAISK